MITSSHKDNSEAVLITQLQKFSDAGGSVIQVRTREPIRAAVALRRHFTSVDNPFREWNASNGFRTQFTAENYVEHKLPGDSADFISALEIPIKELRLASSPVCVQSDKVHYFIFVDPQAHMANNPYVVDLIQQYSVVLPTSNCAIILITDDQPLSMLPTGSCLVTELRTPTVEELEEILTNTLAEVERNTASFPGGHSLDEEDIRRVALLGLGLTYTEFETHSALSVIEAVSNGQEELDVSYLLEGIAKGKTEVVRQSEILELIPAGDMSRVGGMQRMKDWIDQRSNCYSEEAVEFGIEPPKGLVLVGVPGTGKSLVAKAVAASLGVPLVRLDFARVFSKYVGDSEQRVRSALNMVESMAPCVLFVDEIDKGLGGSSGAGGDGGTSSRVLGSYLTWLQESKSPVFNIVTANRVDGLPPELLRRGRFDQVFSVGMPTAAERREVLEIHLRLRNRDIADFDDEDIRTFVAMSNNYVPAEIESVVKDALIAAFSAGEDLTMDHLTKALKELVPMSVSHKARIDAILEWANNNATPVNYPDEPATSLPSASNNRMRILTPRKRPTR